MIPKRAKRETVKATTLTRFFHFLSAVLIILLAWLVFVTAAPLPDHIPLHFASDGTPNSFGNKSSLTILLLVVVMVDGMFYLVLLSLSWFRKRPKLINIPNKEKFLALPAEKQQIYWSLLKEFLAAFVSCLNFTFVTAVWGTIQVASGQVKKLPDWAVWPGMVIILVLNVFYIRRLMRMPRELTDAAP